MRREADGASRRKTFRGTLRSAYEIILFVCVLLLVMLLGAYLGILFWHAVFNNPDAWSLANFHLSILASFRMRWTTITTADASFRRTVRSERLLPVHFVIVIDRSLSHSAALSPDRLLSPAQRCAIEW